MSLITNLQKSDFRVNQGEVRTLAWYTYKLSVCSRQHTSYHIVMEITNKVILHRIQSIQPALLLFLRPCSACTSSLTGPNAPRGAHHIGQVNFKHTTHHATHLATIITIHPSQCHKDYRDTSSSRNKPNRISVETSVSTSTAVEAKNDGKNPGQRPQGTGTVSAAK